MYQCPLIYRVWFFSRSGSARNKFNFLKWGNKRHYGVCHRKWLIFKLYSEVCYHNVYPVQDIRRSLAPVEIILKNAYSYKTEGVPWAWVNVNNKKGARWMKEKCLDHIWNQPRKRCALQHMTKSMTTGPTNKGTRILAKMNNNLSIVYAVGNWNLQ